MVSLHELLILCDSVYKKKNLSDTWHSIQKQGGEQFLSGNIGYFGEAFMNNTSNEIVVVHCGTKVYSIDEKRLINPDTRKLNAFTTYSNLINDGLLALQFIPPETGVALDFGLSITEQYPDCRIIQIGHSLGGLHAHLVGYICKQEVVAFDCPGCFEQLDNLVCHQIDHKQLEKHHSFLAESNLINKTNTQVGNIYRRFSANKSRSKINMIGSVKDTLQSHKLQNFLITIPATTHDYATNIPDIYVKSDNILINKQVISSAFDNLRQGEIMCNSINGDFELTQGAWVLSILRRKSGDHAFLIIEGLDANENPVTMRAELGYKKNGEIIDEHHYHINLTTDVDSKWLKEKTKNQEFSYQSFEISEEKKVKLLEKINTEVQLSRENDLTYVKFGNKRAFAGGFWGTSLKASGLDCIEEASVEANNASFATSKNDSGQMVYHSLDASLQKGHSCVSWAVETVEEVCPNYRPTVVGKIFVMIPQRAIPNNYRGEQNETSCFIL